MKKLIIAIILTIFATITVPAYAKTVIDGVDIDLLSGQERNNFLDARKSAAEKASKLTPGLTELKNLDPKELDGWRQLITGTIKDICQDLNVEVNAFIKSPAGLGISALIVYKVLGKDIIRGIKFFIWIPIYLFMMSFLMWLAKTLYIGKKVKFTAESAIIEGVEHKNVKGHHYLEPKLSIDGGDGFLAAIIFVGIACALTVPTAVALLK